MMWFDTVGCWATEGQAQYSHIGEINSATWNPMRWSTWVDITSSRDAPEIDGVENWGTDVSTFSSSGVNWHSSSGIQDLLQDRIDIRNDCDKDCQKMGSGMTLCAILLSVAMGLIQLNAIIMFAGTWRPMDRIISTYCFPVCGIIQFVMLIVCSVYLFKPYARMCARSLYPTWGENVQWYMSDDYFVMTFSYITQWIWMFVFCCIGTCGMCRVEKKTTA